MSDIDRGISAGVTTAITSAYALIEMTDKTAADALAQKVPDECFLVDLGIRLDTIAGAATITWFLAGDSGGDIPLSPETTTTIVTGVTTGTDGGTLDALRKDHKRPSDVSPAGSLFVAIKLDAGTANARPILTWRIDR